MYRGFAVCLMLACVVACAPPPARATIAPAAAAPTATPTPAPTATATARPVETYIPPSSAGCPVTPLVKDSAPSDPNSDPVRDAYWYINADRTIWASTMPPGSDWHAGQSDKMYWVRPAGTQLTITARRLDGDAPAPDVSIPCCYPTGFQIVGLGFPAAGCWEVDAKTGTSALHFVTLVKP